LASGRALPVLISIVTVNLNDAAGLRATAESVLAQRYRERQWLVIDGGSRDGSRDVIHAFAARSTTGRAPRTGALTTP
jgi:glycosyltransferase involved in cell wall biosynthesis